MVSPTKILVPVAGRPIDQEVVSLACSLAKSARARLYSIYVIEVRRTLPLDVDLPAEVERGEQILQAAEDVARKLRQEIETEILQARDAGTAIVEEVDRRGIDLVVMGLRYRKQYDQFYIGDTAMYVLKNASCRVCLHREQIQ
ncbi:MAG: universal stress protein [Chloroflexota bacterium]